MRVSIVGLGKTGLPIAVALLGKGHSVYGIELSIKRVGEISNHSWIPEEPGCSWEERKNLLIGSIEHAISNSEITILMVNTPESEYNSGIMDLTQVQKAAEEVGVVLRRYGKKRHLLIVSSTVAPGTCRNLIQVIVGEDCKVVFSPVWLALGSVIKDYLNPPVAVVGCDTFLTDKEMSFFTDTFGIVDEKHLLITDTKSAEALKLVYNEWCTYKMSFASRVGEIFKSIGADPTTVEPFFKNGGEQVSKFFKPGPPFGGPCFPRDVRFAEQLAISAGYEPGTEPIVEAIRSTNEAGYWKITDQVWRHLKELGYDNAGPDAPIPTVGIVGLTYKAGVPVLEESSSITLQGHLWKKWRVNVNGYDPLIHDESLIDFPLCISVAEQIECSDVLVEMHQGLVDESCPIPVVRPWI